MLARSDCFPQPCSSTSHMFYRENVTFKLLPINRFVSNTILMTWLVNWIPLRICVRAPHTQPCLEQQTILPAKNVFFPRATNVLSSKNLRGNTAKTNHAASRSFNYQITELIQDKHSENMLASLGSARERRMKF